MLNGAHVLADNDKIADGKRLVQNDGKRGEKVPQDILDGQGNGDAAHPEAGDKGCDVDPHVGQSHQKNDAPQQDASDKRHCGEGGHRCGVDFDFP